VHRAIGDSLIIHFNAIDCPVIGSPRDCSAHLASAWTGGISLLFLVIGLQGAIRPLLPEVPKVLNQLDVGEEVMIESFDPPPAPGDATATAEAVTAEPVPPIEEIEIPPVPPLITPLAPPEMIDLVPVEPMREPEPVTKAPQPKPKTEPSPRKPETKPSPTAATSNRTRTEGAPGGTGSSGSSGGSRRGSFPPPYYPAAARAAGLQGTVKLRVAVEASGMPSSVSVIASSGHSILDAAARDHVQRRWRWPTGEVRSIAVPVRFVLE